MKPRILLLLCAMIAAAALGVWYWLYQNKKATPNTRNDSETAITVGVPPVKEASPAPLPVSANDPPSPAPAPGYGRRGGREGLEVPPDKPAPP